LGCIGEVYEPAYVEDLDIGVRAWQRGWPTVFVAGAQTVHEHRSTTSKYYSEAQLARVLERNWLRFLARTVTSAPVFRSLWEDAIRRLNLKAALEHDEAAADVLAEARHVSEWLEPASAPVVREEQIFAIGSGDVALFPGCAERHARTVLIASCYSPFPLSHGGAVRMYNLMRRAAGDISQVLITFVDELHTPAQELLEICTEIVQVKRHGSHVRADAGRPDVVEEFDSPAFRAALRQTIVKWGPDVVQLEFTQMAQYARDCVPARTVLVEHDITLDLYRQLLEQSDDYDVREQLARWEQFERRAWTEVDCVITMSEKDRETVRGAHCVEVLPNGVDLQRFQPSACEPEPGRLLFIGSFAHLPNLLALDFFLEAVWPRLGSVRPTLHVIAGSRHRFYYGRSRDRLSFSLDTAGLEVEDFVSDVRPAYERASVVIAPLLASAGTNIKIMEAMAMGKAIVSTSSGVNGLPELEPGVDIIVENDAEAMATAILSLLTDPVRRREIERRARTTAERVYDWDAIAAKQRAMYARLRELRQ
jgi:glycosyltransferase involved in cell wall biosynthesis